MKQPGEIYRTLAGTHVWWKPDKQTPPAGFEKGWLHDDFRILYPQIIPPAPGKSMRVKLDPER